MTIPRIEVEDSDAYVGTCDAGCDDETVALVLVEDRWLSMCLRHAHREIDKRWAAALQRRSRETRQVTIR